MRKHIVIIHEIYGITENLRKLEKLLADAGCTVSLPSLYDDGYAGTDEQKSYERFYNYAGIPQSVKKSVTLLRELPNLK